MSVTPLIRTETLEVRAGKRQLIHDISLEINPGEILTVIGPNGAGKSTLLKALIGAVPLSGGRIFRREGLRVGYTPQIIQLEKTIPIPVKRFLSLAGSVDEKSRDKIIEQTDIAHLLNAQMADLSGGELQRVLLARALLRQPELLILDEPTQGLDQPAEARFYALIAEVRDQTGAGIFMVSHDLHVVMAESDRVICLNGHVCCSGAPEHVSADPEYKAMFGSRAALAPYQHRHDHSHDHAGHNHG